ncbi:origin recognition complex subunit 4 C-terminus-domain-containing protein [Sporodiniella umbellata]|nr:origin recognition complex subunit 4 C-terminus-domain-containing protein [Sporodiniella umbellata]
MSKRLASEEPDVPSKLPRLGPCENRISSTILGRLCGRELPNRLHGLSDQYSTLYGLLKQTVSAGESNSCLLFGNRGTGKTALIRTALKELKKTYPDFCVVKLNGLTETTDRLALSEISRQLVTEQSQEERSFGSFAESLEYLLSLLKSGQKDSLPVVFILDEFDLFAQQPKQTLLYNLFDAAQSAQNPMAVIGLTCRLDALDLLEKRVKSRFSHRQIYLFSTTTFNSFVEMAKDTFLVKDAPEFNAAIEELFKNPVMISIVRKVYDISKDIRLLHKISFYPVTKLYTQRYLLAEDFLVSNEAQRSDAKTELLQGISLLELVLIISMKKLLEKEITTFNFQMVYDEYKEFMTQTQVKGQGFGMRLYKRAVALKAFESLQLFELVTPIDSAGKCPKEYRMAKLMLERAQITEAVLKYDCPSIIKKWGTGGA